MHEAMSKVFLSWADDNGNSIREELKNTLLKAGMEVVPYTDIPADESAFIKETEAAIDQADCSVHYLDSKYGKTLDLGGISIAKHQFYEAKKKLSQNPEDFKMFMWYPPDVLQSSKDSDQENFINEVRNSITQNMIFTNADSPIRLVDDIRSMISMDEKTKFEINDAEVFLIYNELDQREAAEIIDMLADIVEPIEKLNIVQDSDFDYSEYCVQQIGRSKLAVVYFKQTADWALPITQQIWKRVGGASSHTPILLIGDDDPESNLDKKFNAPKVISLIIAGDLIPLEIKVQYDTVIEGVDG